MNLKPLILLISTLTVCDGYRILGIFPWNSRSHMMFHEQTMKGLARRGHQVDVVSIFPQKKPYPNYTDIDIPSATPEWTNTATYGLMLEIMRSGIIHVLATVFGNFYCEKGLENPKVRALIENTNNVSYDLVIVEVSFYLSF
ncbi:GSCOCG00004995001-RA-CDS [Cotesia congregata]|nr:GSCOCG00004995001-RA-CDS [Cotesia congregata]